MVILAERNSRSFVEECCFDLEEQMKRSVSQSPELWVGVVAVVPTLKIIKRVEKNNFDLIKNTYQHPHDTVPDVVSRILLVLEQISATRMA
jgi:hypothetical protein